MKTKKSSRRRIDVNLDELDQIIDRGTRAPLSESEGQKLKTALHAMAKRLSWKRSTEKTSAVLNTPAAPASTEEPPKDISATTGHGRNSATAFPGANRVRIAHATLHSGDPCPECGQLTLIRSGACCKCDTCGASSGCS